MKTSFFFDTVPDIFRLILCQIYFVFDGGASSDFRKLDLANFWHLLGMYQLKTKLD